MARRVLLSPPVAANPDIGPTVPRPMAPHPDGAHGRPNHPTAAHPNPCPAAPAPIPGHPDVIRAGRNRDDLDVRRGGSHWGRRRRRSGRHDHRRGRRIRAHGRCTGLGRHGSLSGIGVNWRSRIRGHINHPVLDAARDQCRAPRSYQTDHPMSRFHSLDLLRSCRFGRAISSPRRL